MASILYSVPYHFSFLSVLPSNFFPITATLCNAWKKKWSNVKRKTYTWYTRYPQSNNGSCPPISENRHWSDNWQTSEARGASSFNHVNATPQTRGLSPNFHRNRTKQPPLPPWLNAKILILPDTFWCQQIQDHLDEIRPVLLQDVLSTQTLFYWVVLTKQQHMSDHSGSFFLCCEICKFILEQTHRAKQNVL